MNKRLFVAGLPFSATDEELRNLFQDFGNVVSATIITDRETGRSNGFGFVEMEKEEEAESAMAKLNESDFGGRKLVVNEAKPREERPQGGRGYRQSSGGFGGQRKSFGGRREGGRGNFGRGAGNSGRGGYGHSRY